MNDAAGRRQQDRLDGPHDPRQPRSLRAPPAPPEADDRPLHGRGRPDLAACWRKSSARSSPSPRSTTTPAPRPARSRSHDMKRLYRWDAIGAEHESLRRRRRRRSRTRCRPRSTTPRSTTTGHDGVYLPLLVNPGYESFKAFMESFLAFEPLDLRGLSVTLPHKENALRYLKEKGAEVEPLAERIGAVNTIVIDRVGERDPASAALNTDYAAILDSITDEARHHARATCGLPRRRHRRRRHGPHGRRGAGALRRDGRRLQPHQRARRRAGRRVQRQDRQGRRRAAWKSSATVAATSSSTRRRVGMHPNVDASPARRRSRRSSRPTRSSSTRSTTRSKRSCSSRPKPPARRPIGGVEMFVRQAAAQFEAWTHLPAPADVMRRVFEDRLAGT